METAHIPALFSKQGWLTNVQYTVPCGLCGWKYITNVQYTVPCGRKWKYITSVQYRKYKFHTHTHQTFGYRKEAAI